MSVQILFKKLDGQEALALVHTWKRKEKKLVDDCLLVQ